MEALAIMNETKQETFAGLAIGCVLVFHKTGKLFDGSRLKQIAELRANP